MRKFTVVLTQDEVEPEILNVTVPGLPGCLTYGRGKLEALEHAKEAIECYLKAVDEDERVCLKSELAEVEVDG